MYYFFGAIAVVLVLVVYYKWKKRQRMHRVLANAETDETAFAEILFANNFWAPSRVDDYLIEPQHDIPAKTKWILVKKKNVLLFRVKVPLSLQGPEFEVYPGGVGGNDEARQEMRRVIVNHFRRRYGAPVPA